MKVKKTNTNSFYSSLDTLVSPALRTKSNIEKKMYIEKLISKRKKIIENLKNAKEVESAFIERLTAEIKDLEGCL